MRIFPNNVYIIYVRARHDTEVKNKAKKKKKRFERFSFIGKLHNNYYAKELYPKKIVKIWLN